MQRPSQSASEARARPPSLPGELAPGEAASAALPMGHLRHLLASGPPCYLATLDGRLVYANDEFRDMARALGWEADAPPPYIGSVRSLLEGGDVSVVRTDRCDDGHDGPRLWQSSHRLVRGAPAEPPSIVGHYAVATRLERQRQRAERAEQRLDDMTRLLADWTWETDREGRIADVSSRVRDSLGLFPEQLLGRPLDALGTLSPPEGSALPSANSHAPFRNLRLEVERPDGEHRVVMLSGLPAFDPRSGAFSGFRGIARDATADDAAGAGMPSRERLLSAIESLGDGFSVFDAEGRLVLHNRLFHELFQPGVAMRPGIGYRELLELAVDRGDVALGDADRERWVAERLERLRNPGPASEVRLASGRWVRMVETRTAAGDTVALRTDITELKRREDELARARETADTANRSKSEFLATMSHELRTPLNAIIGFAEIMRDGLYGALEQPQYRSYVSDIHDSASHLLNIINDCLDVAKIEAGEMELHETPQAVGELVAGALRLVEERAERAGVTLVNAVGDDLPALSCDARKIKQVLINLLSNAVKFTPAGGRVTVEAALCDGGLQLHVIDTGIGMATEDIPVALSPFRQIDSGLSRQFDGTGLGLPLSLGLVEMHGGRLTIDSTPGTGTTVTLQFPARRLLARADEAR